MEPALSLPYLKPTALYSLVIHLAAAEQGILPSACSRAIHAQVLAWFRQGDPEVSEAIHARQESPLSLSGLMSQRQARIVRVGDEFYFRIGLLSGGLLEPLLSGLEKAENEPFFLAKFPFVLRSINLLPGTDPWVATSDYTLLAQPATVPNTLTLKFLSPTSFKCNTGQEFQPFPVPEAVFGNLYRRWNTFAPKALKFPRIQWSGAVMAHDLQTEKLRIKNFTIPGAIGWVKYQFSKPDQAKIATTLAHFAFFAGVGCKTAMGMGQTILIEAKNNK